jgi:hypothetical protein
MMSEVTAVLSEGGKTSDGFEALANLNEGFLGTGYSSSVELSYMVMALIVGYVAISMVKYFLPEFSILRTLTGAIGLRDR